MILKQQQLGPWAAVSVLLCVLVDVSSGMTSIQLIPQYPVIGGSVTLSVTGNTGGNNSFVWCKGPNTYMNYTILSYSSDDKSPLKPGHLFHSRVTPFSNGSLQISNLNITDEGHYIVRIQAENVSDTSVYLKIFDMVGKPTITTSTSHPKENDTVTLTCTSTNAEMIVWSRVPSGATLSPDNRTVCFSRIKRSDSGEYRCQANNPVSKANSDPITITVGYGPENVKVNTQRSPSNSFILLECSADSVPPATYQWRLNGIDINVQQNSFQVNLSKAKEEGTYTCVANNSVTHLTAIDSIYVNVTIELTDDDDYNGIYSQTSIIGTISGIVIGSVLLLVLVIVLAYLFGRHRRHKKQSNSAKNESPVYENMEATQESQYEMQATQESQYEQLAHKDRTIYSTLPSKTGKP